VKGLHCRLETRRRDVRDKESNGLDYVDVDDTQTHLCVHFLGKIPSGLRRENVVIRGGRRRDGVRVVAIETHKENDPEKDDCLRVTVDAPGDASTYELCLVATDESGRPTSRPLPGLDPRYACVCFSFKASCPSDRDCAEASSCPDERPADAPADYLAKDYESFRRLAFDRLATLTPDWTERHAPDVGVALVELLAYEADRLSYFQDAVATEAYLDTARRRISVRRHARLVDYRLHEGCNARAWLFIEAMADMDLSLADVLFSTHAADLPRGAVIAEHDLQRLRPGAVEVFEPLEPKQKLRLRRAHDQIAIYTWGDRFCCLAKGVTAATLLDTWAGDATADDRPRTLALEAGDFLLFEEVKSPTTGQSEDADPARRHVVRLTAVHPAIDTLYGLPIVEVEWAAEDALPFALCISALGPAPECDELLAVSVARGNVLLVDHGATTAEALGPVGEDDSPPPCECTGRTADVTPQPSPFEPSLRGVPLTFAEPLLQDSSAASLLEQDVRRALPAIRIADWEARIDLLDSDAADRHFVVEVDDEGVAHLRFGDDVSGRRPPAGASFEVRYRVGNGPDGSVGAEAITHVCFRNEVVSGLIASVRNPLAARGGSAREPLDVARLAAPQAFRRERQRAIVAEDYARLAEVDGVQGAAAALRWSGSWHEADVGIDAAVTGTPTSALLARVRARLERARRIGHDLRVGPASEVPLRLAMRVCVEPHHLRGHVASALRALFSARTLPDGTKGLFHPVALRFGDDVSMSRLVAAAQSVEGVESVEVTRFERLFGGPDGGIEDGLLRLGPLEVARLDADPAAPENGVFDLELRGGR
jgi:hypothetical protein